MTTKLLIKTADVSVFHFSTLMKFELHVNPHLCSSSSLHAENESNLLPINQLLGIYGLCSKSPCSMLVGAV